VGANVCWLYVSEKQTALTSGKGRMTAEHLAHASTYLPTTYLPGISFSGSTRCSSHLNIESFLGLKGGQSS
jgi:hypothetical protein